MTPKVDDITDAKGLDGASTNALLLSAEQAIRASGDRLVYSPKGAAPCDYDKDLFVECSRDPAACLEKVGTVRSAHSGRYPSTFFFQLLASMPTANAEDPCRSEGT